MDKLTENQKKTAKARSVLKKHGAYKHNAASGVIESDKVYSLKAFVETLGTTESKVIEMRARGLKVKKNGTSVFVTGRAYFDFIESLPDAALPCRDPSTSNVSNP